MSTGSPGDTRTDGLGLSSGSGSDRDSDDDDENDTGNSSGGVVQVGGDTDDEVPPDGENFFGRAGKQGAAPAGANPFAVSTTHTGAPEDDWQQQIAEAKAMVEQQRLKREAEEAVEKQAEQAAAEMKGKVWEERRKAGDPAPAENTNSSGSSAHGRVRKMLKARRPGSQDDKKNESAAVASPFVFGGNLVADTSNKPLTAASPFAGFSLLAEPTKSPAFDQTEQPKSISGGIRSRLSGSPVPFEPVAEADEEEEEEEDDESESEEDATGAVPAVPLFSGFGSVTTKSDAPAPVAGPSSFFSTLKPAVSKIYAPTPVATLPSSSGKVRTPLAVELDL
tara:strand:- start:3729 stop:4736 length:1008 start_codon:yes stop_codon:yes gene_type:complete